MCLGGLGGLCHAAPWGEPRGRACVLRPWFAEHWQTRYSRASLSTNSGVSRLWESCLLSAAGLSYGAQPLRTQHRLEVPAVGPWGTLTAFRFGNKTAVTLPCASTVSCQAGHGWGQRGWGRRWLSPSSASESRRNPLELRLSPSDSAPRWGL